MDLPGALLLTALLMGVAGGPHCIAMCGPACAGIARGGRGQWAFHGGRIAGYATLGAIAAGAFQSLGWLTAASAAARPLWTLFHMALLLLGLTLLWKARQPQWLEDVGRAVWRRARGVAPQRAMADGAVLLQRVGPGAAAGSPGAGQSTRQREAAPLPFAAGLLWALMPCGLLYSALMVAVLAGSAAGGAMAMAAFAVGSALSLALAPWLWRHWQARLPRAWGIRIAGALLAAFSLWALWMGDMAGTMPWCAAPAG